MSVCQGDQGRIPVRDQQASAHTSAAHGPDHQQPHRPQRDYYVIQRYLDARGLGPARSRPGSAHTAGWPPPAAQPPGRRQRGYCGRPGCWDGCRPGPARGQPASAHTAGWPPPAARQVSTHRSMTAFILGIWTPLSTTFIPASLSTASNRPGTLAFERGHDNQPRRVLLQHPLVGVGDGLGDVDQVVIHDAAARRGVQIRAPRRSGFPSWWRRRTPRSPLSVAPR